MITYFNYETIKMKILGLVLVVWSFMSMTNLIYPSDGSVFSNNITKIYYNDGLVIRDSITMLWIFTVAVGLMLLPTILSPSYLRR